MLNILEKNKNIFDYKSLNSITKKEKNKIEYKEKNVIQDTLDQKEYNNIIYYPSSSKDPLSWTGFQRTTKNQNLSRMDRKRIDVDPRTHRR